MLKKITIYSLMLLTLNCLLLTNIYAEEDVAAPNPDQNIAESWIITPKVGMTGQFETALKAHMNYRSSKGDPRKWSTYTPYVGNDMGHYIVRQCCMTWAQADEYNAWDESAKSNQHWNETVDQYVQSYEHYFAAVDFENSNWKNDPDYRYFGVSNLMPKRGVGKELKAAVKQISDYAKAGEWPRNWSWTSTIGGSGGMSLVSPMKTLTEMKTDKPFSKIVAEQMRSEKKADAFLKNYSNLFEKSTYQIYVVRPDLSMAME